MMANFSPGRGIEALTDISNQIKVPMISIDEMAILDIKATIALPLQLHVHVSLTMQDER